MSIYANAHRKEGAREVEPADFMPGAPERDEPRGMPGFDALAASFRTPMKQITWP